MRDFDYSESCDFLARFFEHTTEAVEIRALPNVKDEGAARPLFTRQAKLVSDHCVKWDDIGRAVYFGVATRQPGFGKGDRAHCCELPALWVDIDTYKLNITKEQAIDAASNQIEYPPSIIVDSGGGIHCYWLLREPIDIRKTDRDEQIVDVLKQLAGILAGDLSVCDLARIMRLPGTHNTKTDLEQPQLAHIVGGSNVAIEFNDIVEMLDRQRPVLIAPLTNGHAKPHDNNPYLAAARLLSFKPAIDTEQRLAAMQYLGNGDTGIHQTQLSVSASLVAQGEEDQKIVDSIMAATRAAAGQYVDNWNWKREEASIRAMVASAHTKFTKPREEQKPPQSANNSGNGATVVNLVTKREEAHQKKKKDDGPEPIISVGESTITYWEQNHGTLISTGETMATYNAPSGIWELFNEEVEHRLRVAIQGIAATLSVKPTSSVLNSIWRYIKERPRLHRESVPWDKSGLVVCNDCVINPATGETSTINPELYATWRINCAYDPTAACPQFIAFLKSALDGMNDNEMQAAIDCLTEHMGASLVSGKPRNLRKALFFLGKSRSGKTRIANIYRALFGGPARCASIKATDLDDLFGVAPLLHAAAWIADDVIEQASSTSKPLSAERFKVIVTGEPISIRIAGGTYVSHPGLDIPVIWTGNSLPKIRDDSEAVYNRMLIFPLNREWPEDAANTDPQLREIDQIVIEEELAGVLNLAMQGWRRLRARGRFDPPINMVAAIDELREINQPIGNWITECVAIDKRYKVDNRDLVACMTEWWRQQFGEADKQNKPPGGRTLLAVLKRRCPSSKPGKSNGARLTAGIRLTEDGLSYIDAARLTQPFGGTLGSGHTTEGVNQPTHEPPF